MMKWPWRRKGGDDRLVLSLSGDSLAYGRSVNGRLVRCGVEPRGTDTPQAFARRVRSMGLQSSHVSAVLALHECQLLQIDAPAVPPAELKAAARWRIKELVDAHLDDLTLDVMVVGDGRARNQRQLFVAAAHTKAIREMSEWCVAAGLELSVIDIRETAQRNLQSAAAQARDAQPRRGEFASAALLRQGELCLLTICAHGELFYSRRLAWDGQALGGAASLTSSRDAPSFADSTAAELEMMDIVDYGADVDAVAGTSSVTGDEGQRFVVELQRSLDLWERSWPDLPLERLSIQMGEDTQAAAELLRPALAIPVEALEPERALPGFMQAATTPAVRAAVVPVLGALLRTESRQL